MNISKPKEIFSWPTAGIIRGLMGARDCLKLTFN